MCFHKLGAMCATTASTVFCVVVCCFDMFLVDRFGHSCASVRQTIIACLLTSFVVVDLCSVVANSGHNKGLDTHGCFDRP